MTQFTLNMYSYEMNLKYLIFIFSTYEQAYFTLFPLYILSQTLSESIPFINFFMCKIMYFQLDNYFLNTNEILLNPLSYINFIIYHKKKSDLIIRFDINFLTIDFA